MNSTTAARTANDGRLCPGDHAIDEPIFPRTTTYFKRPDENRRYGQRRQVETVMSTIKRRLVSTLNTRRRQPQNRALLLKEIAHNILILHACRGFLRSKLIGE